jgi:co-chaperonin GroES (HSP10)
MIKPLNNHVLLELVKHDSFIASQKERYEEIGLVIDIDAEQGIRDLLIGKKVLFSGWLAKKFPKEGTDEVYWLVDLKDLVAYEE